MRLSGSEQSRSEPIQIILRVALGANQVLANLQPEEIRRLREHLEPITLARRSTLFEAGAKLKYVYFPTSGIVSCVHTMSDGASVEVAIVGNEGMLGVWSLFGLNSSTQRAAVRHAGHGYRIKAEVLQREFDRNGQFHRLVLRYGTSLIAQIAQSAACNRHHSLDQQLCRWLLMSLDRLPSNQLTATQELIASMLGVRRQSVTEAARSLQEAGLIRNARGRISVLSRAQLEARACECYASMRALRSRVARTT
jgi:CRP-like cAMP-binding protein